MTELEKMLSGLPYRPSDPELSAMRLRCREILREYNSSSAADSETRKRLLEALFGGFPENLVVEPAFRCDYGANIEFGKNVFVNFNCVILDCARVKIGDNAFIGPNVQIYTAAHPLDVAARNSGAESALPVEIGGDCWIGGSAVVLPGVKIGSGCVIAAGAVVVKDIPPNSLAAGNPAQVKRSLK